ncbi:MAG: type II toxin-antitoxin system PemK/MazF family toxin [Acidimicrobiia bacterium]|nr:type II toxin-antitoxin system PemK/MazF family toxin [Acidimicrobiia bacterium]
MATLPIRRGDVVWVNLKGAIGAEKQKTRPCVVVQNNRGNTASAVTIVAPLTDANQAKEYREHVLVEATELGPGAKRSVVDCGQLRTIDRDQRIDLARGVTARLSAATMAKIDEALRASLAL